MGIGALQGLIQNSTCVAKVFPQASSFAGSKDEMARRVGLSTAGQSEPKNTWGLQAMTSAAGLPSMLDREELVAQTMRLRSQHAELQQRVETQRKVQQERPLVLSARGWAPESGSIPGHSSRPLWTGKRPVTCSKVCITVAVAFSGL